MFGSVLMDVFVLTGCLSSVFVLVMRQKRHGVSRFLLDEVVDTLEIGKIIFDRNGLFLKANCLAVQFFPFLNAHEKQSFKLSDFLDYVYDNSASDPDNAYVPAVDPVRDEAVYDFREIIYFADGRICLVRGQKFISGEYIFTINDISSNKKREDHMRSLGKENYQLSQAVAAVNSGILISDPSKEGNKIIFVNDALCTFINVGREELLGSEWVPLLRMMKDKSEREKLIEAINQEQEIELEACRKQGDLVRWFSVKITPIYNLYGQLDLIVAVLNETTLLKQREAEFFHAQKLEALGQLAAGIAHDFNNILSIIDGFAMMLKGHIHDGDDKTKGYLDRISVASQRGAGLTRKMLTFGSHKVVRKNVVDVRSILADQEALLLPLLSSDIVLKIVLPQEPVHVKCSSDSLAHIIMNLAINAKDAMYGSGTLIAELSMIDRAKLPEKIKAHLAEDRYACLMIADTGTGMDEKTLAKVFDPFFSTKERNKGTGLGLSVVYGLVQELGGYIDISSKLGEGTQVSVYMPISDEPVSKAISGNLKDIQDMRLDGFTMMVVEDEPDLREIVSQILENAGVTVLRADNGVDALCLQDEFDDDIDVLITDVVMPEMNGVKLAELFSAVRPEARIIFMSGYPAGGDMAPVELPEDAHFIAKPVNYESLIKVLYLVLTQRELNKQAEFMAEVAHWESVN